MKDYEEIEKGLSRDYLSISCAYCLIMKRHRRGFSKEAPNTIEDNHFVTKRETPIKPLKVHREARIRSGWKKNSPRSDFSILQIIW